MLEVRRHWFGAYEVERRGALSVMEPGGELLMLVDHEGPQADRLIEEAADRGAYVVVTDHSRPTDLAARLGREGYRLVQRHGTYIFTGPVPSVPTPRRGLLSLLRLKEPLPVTVREITEADLPAWNEVCWWAFGPRGTQEASLVEKQRAFASMGDLGRWYLAYVGGRPVGTACLFQGHEAAQVLAVGTLPAYRGRGVARAVMDRLVRDWEERGSGLLFLDTKPGSDAERLYLRMGFEHAYLRDLYAPSLRLARD